MGNYLGAGDAAHSAKQFSQVVFRGLKRQVANVESRRGDFDDFRFRSDAGGGGRGGGTVTFGNWTGRLMAIPFEEGEDALPKGG